MPMWTGSLTDVETAKTKLMLTGKVPQSNLIAVVKFKFERMFVFRFFLIPLSHATKKSDIFFNIVCRTESL